jgi:ABC-type multidrug transport system fused ATPase/permease subunit
MTDPDAHTIKTAGERLVARVRQQLFKALVMQDIAFYDSAKTGELMNRLAADTTGA